MEYIDYWVQVKELSLQSGEIDYELINALHWFEFWWTQEIFVIASHLIEIGKSHPALVEIQQINDPIYNEYQTLLETWLRDNGQLPLTKRQAGLLLAKVVCRRIASGNIPPLEGGKIILKDIYYEAETPQELLPFINNTNAYLDCLTMLNEERREYLDEISAAAREFIKPNND